jgi:hypothetical protein
MRDRSRTRRLSAGAPDGHPGRPDLRYCRKRLVLPRLKATRERLLKVRIVRELQRVKVDEDQPLLRAVDDG